jgi:hypothetical protein
MFLNRGLGATPDDICYDANRSWWMPYWYQDAVETACFSTHLAMEVTGGGLLAKEYLMPPRPSTPGAPQTYAQMTVPGAWTPDQAIKAGDDQTKANLLNFFTGLDAKLNPPNQPISSLALAALAIVGGVVVYGLVS